MLTSLLLALMTVAALPAETTATLPATATQPSLFVRHLQGKGPSVIYVHGATFPSGSSIFYRIDGKSWADDLVARGFDVWGFDLAGYGKSGRHDAMRAASGAPIGRSADVALQIERVVAHVQSVRPGKIILLAHSWGTIPAGIFAAAHPDKVEKLILFGAVAERNGTRGTTDVPALQVSEQDQWESFQYGVPADESSPIAKDIFHAWVQDYLASDPAASMQAPPSVRVPSGPQADIDDAWSGRFPYDPSQIGVPTLIVRGAWDAVSNESDVAWLAARIPTVRTLTLPRGAHRMHLETNRQALFDAVGDDLLQPTTRRRQN